MNTYAFAGTGTSNRFQPFTASEFTNEFRANGWDNVYNFYLEHLGSNRYGFSGKVDSNNSIAASEAILKPYFQHYFNSLSWRMIQLNITPINITPTNAGGGGTYTVRSGDNLSRIANAHGITVANLVALNSRSYPNLLTNPNLINVGWVLNVGKTSASVPVVPNVPVVPSSPNVPIGNTTVPTKQSSLIDSLKETFGTTGLIIGGLAVVGLVVIASKPKR